MRLKTFEMTPTSFVVQAEMKQWLREYADDYGLTLGAVIRIALHDFRQRAEEGESDDK